ncbi:50S ribosomal protein L17 [Candidatus Dependentiae bacterium]|nr:MAG: 50S ribosomal protein L17 [Candidatus Dependentiae bacterium]
MTKKHQNGRSKLNMKGPHRVAVLRNQMIHLIKFGSLKTTKARVKEVRRLIEKLVTIARKGYDFNTIRRLRKELPYDFSAVQKLIKEIAPQYLGREGGYTRIILLGKRASDTAPIARLEWV